MDAVEYLKNQGRMCRGNIKCYGCPFYMTNNGQGMTCITLQAIFPEKAIEIVKKWSEEHPRKTYAQDFKEKLPKCTYNLSDICRKDIYGEEFDCDKYESCAKCWDEEYKEEYKEE